MFGLLFFFFNDTATTEIYTLSLHDALPILGRLQPLGIGVHERLEMRAGDLFLALGDHLQVQGQLAGAVEPRLNRRSEEHTSELQSRLHLVCRLLLEKKRIRSLRASPSTLDR